MKKLAVKNISTKWVFTTILPIFAIAGAVIGIFTFFIFPTAAAAGLGFGAKLLAWIIFIILYALIMSVGILIIIFLYNTLAPKLGQILLTVEEIEE